MQINRLAFIGNSLPRHCGIATFTSDLQQAIATSCPYVGTSIVAMTDIDGAYDYPSVVGIEVNDGSMDDYARAADFLNAGQFDVVSLQHEFGIFGGEAGHYIMTLLERLNMPIVTTFHTVLTNPTPVQQSIMERIITVSSKAVVMAEKGREVLRTIYNVPTDKIEVIPHGIPDYEFVEPDRAKDAFGFSSKPVILTFGLLSPNKGIEVMIDAMPTILECRPDAVYVVLGATHPNLVRHQGEAYRDSLMARARALGIEDHVVFLDQFVVQSTLLDFISMCDVYVTPYLNKAQMTSGTLAYSFGLGKAVVSTPYWHAQELLADGRGILVPFGDAATTGQEIADLLSDDNRRQAMRKRAYSSSRSMTWERTADRYLKVFETARSGHRMRVIAHHDKCAPLQESYSPPEMKIDHLLSMCDDTGLFQHAIHSVPDRSHGYCLDDNARALLLACELNSLGETCLPETLTARLAAFVQHAWNPDARRFRNFMNFDRRWLDDYGSEDSNGRALWALGETARNDTNPSRRHWAAALFIEALPMAESFGSPRAWSFTLLGLDAYCSVVSGHSLAERLRTVLADRLMRILSAVESKDWVWFEEGLAYDNARMPQALIVTGVAAGVPAYIDAGLRSLRWLMSVQTTATGFFRPVGTDSFGNSQKTLPQIFDQQPLEAAATISACLAAWRADGNIEWKNDVERAFAWFLGYNDLSSPMIDPETGSCRDGLHPERPNENRGGESVVSYLLSLAEVRKLARLNKGRAKFVPRLA